MKRCVLLADHARRVVKLTVLTFAFAQMASAADLYVATNATGDGSGSSWANATNSLQGAIDAIAANATNTVWVSNGVYQTGGRTNYPVGSLLTNRVEISKGITVRSANNDPTNTIIKGAWDPATNGPAAVRCVYMVGGSSLIGFTITNGATRTDAVVINTDNRGGGVSANAIAGTVSNCIITGNTAGGIGGGAYGTTLRNCTIVGNNTLSGGGGASYCSLYNCTLSGNVGGNGGAAFDSYMYNCLLIGNSAGSGGGMYYDGSVGGQMYNCTIVGNKATGSTGGGGVRTGYAIVLKMHNCIIYSNTATVTGDNYNSTETSAIAFTNCCTTPSNSAGWADGNITNDPVFVAYGIGYGTNHVAGNYRLQANSPCVNTGTNGSWTTTYPTDLDGRRRIDRLFGRVDMGAYEFIHKITLISGH